MTTAVFDAQALAGVRAPSSLNRRTLALGLFALLCLAALVPAVVLPSEIVNPGGWPALWRFCRGALRPDLSPTMLRLAGHSALVTFAFAFAGTFLGVALGLVPAVLSSQTFWRARAFGGERDHPWLSWLAARAISAVPRSVHEVIWGLFFINVFGLDPLAGILAIALPFGLITGKVYSEILDETPREPMEALLAAGATPLRAFVYGLVPAAFPYLVAYALYRLECAIRTAVVLGLIGAGGLGYQILISLQSLRYEQVWVFIYALMALVGLADAWGSLLARRLDISVRGDLRARVRRGLRIRAGGDAVLGASLVLAALLLPASLIYLGPDLTRLMSRETAGRLAAIVLEALPPHVEAAQLLPLVRLTYETFSMSILAIALAGVGGLILSFPASTTFAFSGGIFTGESGPGRAFRFSVLILTRLLLLFTRSMSDAIWALVLLFVIFPGIWAGALALAFYNVGVLGRLMSQVNESADTRPLRALQAQGASGPQTLLYGLLPASLPKCIGYMMYRWEICARATVVVGVAGAGGLGQLLEHQLAAFDYPSLSTTLAFYVGLTLVVDLASAAVRRAVQDA